jgi:hypothetical protein
MAPYHDWGAVTNLDDRSGRLLQKLDELGLAGNTIVPFSSNSSRNARIRGRRPLPSSVRWPRYVPAGQYDTAPLTVTLIVEASIISMALGGGRRICSEACTYRCGKTRRFR